MVTGRVNTRTYRIQKHDPRKEGTESFGVVCPVVIFRSKSFKVVLREQNRDIVACVKARVSLPAATTTKGEE